jgi:hypothetical protein
MAIFETMPNLLEALVDLISAYYVFDVNYPESMSRVLCFLQHFVWMQQMALRGPSSTPRLYRNLKMICILLKQCKTKTENFFMWVSLSKGRFCQHGRHPKTQAIFCIRKSCIRKQKCFVICGEDYHKLIQTDSNRVFNSCWQKHRLL